MTWVVDHVYPAGKWSILNLATGQRKVIGPARMTKTNYYDKAVREAARRNEKEKLHDRRAQAL